MKEDFLPDPSVAVSLSTRIRKRISTPKEDVIADAAEDLLAACQEAIASLRSQLKYITDDAQAHGHASDAMRVLSAAIAKATNK